MPLLTASVLAGGILVSATLLRSWKKWRPLTRHVWLKPIHSSQYGSTTLLNGSHGPNSLPSRPDPVGQTLNFNLGLSVGAAGLAIVGFYGFPLFTWLGAFPPCDA